MSRPEIAQAPMIAADFGALLREVSPSSVAVVGCAGGNGFDRIDPGTTARVVGIDINPAYLEKVRERFSHRFLQLELWPGDIGSTKPPVEPVELVYAALILEYVELSSALHNISAVLAPRGLLGVLLQLPTPTLPEITPSPYPSLGTLAPVLRLKSPTALRSAASRAGLAYRDSHEILLASGKRFSSLTFRKGRRGGRKGNR